MMLCNFNFLVLDEPNNHLDLEAVAALSWALEDFKGTVVMASHDRILLNEVATKIVAFEEDRIDIFNGPLEEYLSS
jgi:ATPase subunit of ABC transporter with duplicated ATPase domains